MNGDLEGLQVRIGHTFRDPSLLERALTHTSWVFEHPGAKGSNQRLEFLGDSVLGLILTEALYALYPESSEGELTTRRAILGKGEFLSRLAREIGLAACLRLGAGEEANGGRNRDGTLEDAFEALIGAIRLDSGFESARNVALGIYGNIPTRLEELETDANPKGRLQEIVQPVHGNLALRYEVTATEGADHKRTFEVAVHLLERRIGSGKGPTKRIAEEEAARAALQVVRQDPPR